MVGVPQPLAKQPSTSRDVANQDIRISEYQNIRRFNSTDDAGTAHRSSPQFETGNFSLCCELRCRVMHY